MTAPDPGLTDLIAAALGDKIMHTNGSGDRNRAYAAHVALVVEQHTNGRITELEVERDQAIAHDRQPYPTAWAYEQACAALEKHRKRADKHEATIARVEKLAHDMRGWCSPHGISVTYSDRICAVLEGESWTGS